MFDKQFVWLIVISFIVGAVLSALVVVNLTRPVVQQVTQGVQHSDTVTITGKSVHDTVRTHTTTVTYNIDTVQLLVMGKPDTVIRKDSTYSYGFALSFPDSAKIGLKFITTSIPEIPDNSLALQSNYTPAPQRTITNTRTDTVTVKQNNLFALVVGIGAGIDYNKKFTASANITYGIRLK
jgi:hypothetical protein